MCEVFVPNDFRFLQEMALLGLSLGPACTGSTTVLTEGAARVASVLAICVRPAIMSHDIAETHQKCAAPR